MPTPDPQLPPQDLERLFSAERLSTYIDHCGGYFAAAVELYRWNSAITAAFWEPIGHLEVALRNTLDDRLAARHRRLERPGSWLDDPAQELSGRARLDIAVARDRVRQKGKRASDGQTISELSFGFWRFLITKKLTGLWPDLASGFPHTHRTVSLERSRVRLLAFTSSATVSRTTSASGATRPTNVTKTSSPSPATSTRLYQTGLRAPAGSRRRSAPNRDGSTTVRSDPRVRCKSVPMEPAEVNAKRFARLPCGLYGARSAASWRCLEARGCGQRRKELARNYCTHSFGWHDATSKRTDG